MDISSQSSSAFSDQQTKEKYIKKNIVPIRRGPSAIFGDPISQQNGYMELPSPHTSQPNSKINTDKEEKQKEEPLKEREKEVIQAEDVVQGERKQEEYERVNNRNEEQQMENDQESVKDSSLSPINIQHVKQNPQNPIIQEQQRQEVVQNNRVSENPLPRSTLSNQSNKQQRPDHPIQPLRLDNNAESQILNQSNHLPQNIKPILQQELMDFSHIVQLDVQEQQSQINQQIFTESNINKLRLKHKKLHVIQQASDQSKLILEILYRNTQHLQSIEERINGQSVILNQFKEQTSRKLEENVKLALREKMNEINRQNSKQLKDIKNLCIILQELFLQNSKRMDIMQKKLDTLLPNPNANPTLIHK